MTAKKKVVKRAVRRAKPVVTTLALLTQTLTGMYGSDTLAPGIVISYIGGEKKHFYASIVRYPKNPSMKEVSYKTYGPTPEAVVEHIARSIAGMTEPMENLRKHLGK